MSTTGQSPRTSGGAPARLASASGGTLPDWSPYAVVAGSIGLMAALFAAGAFSIGVALVASTVISCAAMYVLSLKVEGRRRAADRASLLVIIAFFAVAMVPLISLLYQVISRGVHRFDVAFFTESQAGVIGGAGGGAEHAILGTLIITGIATVISVPVGIMAAIYLNEYSTGKLRRPLTFFVDVMTGIPSIVAGLFAFALFALFLGPGIRLGIIGSVALSVLMIPIVVRSAEEILKIVPDHLREAAYALGTPKWKIIVRIVLPTAMAGLVTGVMLAVARVIGETAPLLVTTGVIDSTNTDPFSGRMQNLAVYAFYEYKNPGIDVQASYDKAWAAALTLLVIVMLLSLFARFFYRRYGTDIR